MKPEMLHKQMQKASEEMQKWEPWMRREAGLDNQDKRQPQTQNAGKAKS